MALPVNELKTAYTNATIVLSGTRIYYRLEYQLVHVPTGAIIFSSSRQMNVPSMERIAIADVSLRAEIAGDVQTVMELHKGREVLNHASLYDVTRTLDRWAFVSGEEGWTLTHPLSGTFAKVAMADEGILNRYFAVRNLVLPPPRWAFVEGGIGEIEVSCIAVPGAESYNVYDDHTYLATVPSAARHRVSLPPGTYTIRVGAVSKEGIVGILGNEGIVTVGALITETRVESAPVAAVEPKPNAMDRLRTLWKQIRKKE